MVSCLYRIRNNRYSDVENFRRFYRYHSFYRSSSQLCFILLFIVFVLNLLNVKPGIWYLGRHRDSINRYCWHPYLGGSCYIIKRYRHPFNYSWCNFTKNEGLKTKKENSIVRRIKSDWSLKMDTITFLYYLFYNNRHISRFLSLIRG